MGIYFAAYYDFSIGFWNCTDSVKFFGFFYFITSVDTEMCCPKGKCGCQYFILLTLKKNRGRRGPGYFNKKTNPGILFLLKVRSCDVISNFHHSPLPLPK